LTGRSPLLTVTSTVRRRGDRGLVGLADGGFESANERRRYLAVYDEVRALSPQPDVVHDIPTEFGTVRVYQHGPDGGAPVVLIHGFFLTSAMWWEQVTGLTGDFTVYAMDMLGQPGASTQSKSMFNPADCVRSIDAVLQGLRLREVHLVGHSYGVGLPLTARRGRRVCWQRSHWLTRPAQWLDSLHGSGEVLRSYFRVRVPCELNARRRGLRDTPSPAVPSIC
jgi:hypothetical protein